MKREYVKPVIEGELFVANEYVAACFTMTCTNNDGSCGSNEYHIKGTDFTIDDFVEYPDNKVVGVFGGTINGKDAKDCRNKDTYQFNKDFSISSAYGNTIKPWVENKLELENFHPVDIVRNASV